jgi:hypothetical protein
VSIRRPWILVCVLVMALGLAACGQESHPTKADANNDGFYVDAGPLTYQLQISRELNPYNNHEDAQYVSGLPAGQAQPKPGDIWYGVFLWAKNQTHRAVATTDSFDIVDTQGTKYYPLRLDPALNGYAWTSQVLQPAETEPEADTTASFGPTQGGLVLFKLNISIYANRPLTLQIFAPGASKPSTISLDL